MRQTQISKKQYIEAAFAILSTEGREALSIRRLGRALNCNLANLYRYFRGLDELLVYASLRYLSSYLLDVQACYKTISDSLELHVAIWQRFARHSFAKPEAWDNIFFGPYSSELDAILQDYYAMFPEDMGSLSESVCEVYRTGNFDYRNFLMVKACIADGYFSEAAGKELNTLSIYLYKGFLKECLEARAQGQELAPEAATQRFLALLQALIRHYLLQPA